MINEFVILECYPDKIYEAFCMEDLLNNREVAVDSKKVDRFVFYCDLGMTKEMDKKLMKIQKSSRYDIRWLPNDSWNRYISELKKCGMDVPRRKVRI